MERATVATFAFWCTVTCCAATTVTDHRGMFGYPDDDHVIITQYGPMRYQPAAVQTNVAGGGDVQVSPSGRGYYKAEVIPLDMNTWKPVRQPDVVGSFGKGNVNVDAFDVPLGVGYSVRPTAVVRRRRKNDYFSTGRPHSGYSGYSGHSGYSGTQAYPRVRLLQPRPQVSGGLWMF